MHPLGQALINASRHVEANVKPGLILVHENRSESRRHQRTTFPISIKRFTTFGLRCLTDGTGLLDSVSQLPRDFARTSSRNWAKWLHLALSRGNRPKVKVERLLYAFMFQIRGVRATPT
jgi:hypothetical protein